MKKIKLALGLLIVPFIGLSQSTTATNNQNVLQNRYLGFVNNFPLTTRTNDILRMKLNHSINYSVNAYPAQSKDGYLLLGQTTQASSQIFNNNNFGAFSMLHLNGSDNGTGVLQQGGLFTPEWIENRKRNHKERHSVWIVRLKVF